VIVAITVSLMHRVVPTASTVAPPRKTDSVSRGKPVAAVQPSEGIPGKKSYMQG
jgi:hypothetical protein